MSNVNHPSHYADSCSLECIEVMDLYYNSTEIQTFCELNAFKYLWRHKKKNNLEDLEKAQWYVSKGMEYGRTNQLLKFQKLIDKKKGEINE